MELRTQTWTPDKLTSCPSSATDWLYERPWVTPFSGPQFTHLESGNNNHSTLIKRLQELMHM